MSDYRSKEGKVYSENELKKFAEEANYSFEEYLLAGGFELDDKEGKKTGATTNDAGVVPQEIQPVNTGLASEDTSLVSPEPETRKGRAQVRKEELERIENTPFVDELKEKIRQERIAEDPEKADMGRGFSRALEIGLNIVGGYISSMPETVYNVFALPQNLIASATEDESWATDADTFKKQLEVENKALDYYNEEVSRLSEEQKEFKRLQFGSKTGVAENFADGNITEAFTLMGLGLVESAPTSISMMVGGAVMSTAAKAAAVTTPFFMESARQELKEENPEMGAAELTFKSLGIAGAETVFAAISNKALTNAYKDIVKREGLEIGTKVFKDGIVKMYTTALKKYGAGAGMIGEGIEEVATQMTQNAIKGKDITEGAADAFLLGVGGGAVYSSPMSIATVKNYAETKKAISKINEIVVDSPVNNINKLFDQAMADPVTAAQFDVVKIKNADKALKRNLQQSIDNGDITREQASQSLAKFNQVQYASKQIEKTGFGFTSEQGVEVVNLLTEKDNIKKKIKGVDEALVFTQKERIKEINNSLNDISRSASEVKLKTETEIVEKLAGKENVKSFDTVEEFVKTTGQPAEADAFIDENGIIFINKQRAAEVSAFSAASHELLHRVLKSTFSDKTASTNLVKDFNKVLEKEGYLDIVQKRIDDNYRFNKDGSEKAFEEYAEEYLTAFSDAIAKNDIEFNETKFQKLMQPIVKFFRKVGYNKIDFKNGKDVYDFIKDYRSNIDKGELSKRATALQAKGQAVTSTPKASVTKINEQIKALEDQYESGEIDYDDYDQQLSNLETKLERAKTTSTEEAKITKPKEDKREVKQLGDALNKLIPEGTTNKEYKERIVGTVAAELSGKTLNPLIKKIAAGYGVVADNVYGKSWEDFYIAVKGVQFIKNLQKFNPEINDDFGGFIIGSQYGIRNRVKEALIKFKKENEGGFKEDVSIAKGIAAEETAAPEAAEKAKYKNLLQQKVLSTEGLKTARTKVISSVRVLKSKIDAVVTKNVAVTPIIEEIRISVGKQLDIIFKKEMGGKPKEKFKNYLLTNKKAILENLTTTYLLRAMPQTIQKSVGGKYLLNKDGSKVINSFGDATFSPNFVNYDVWKDAKADREKTSTEAAGRTSGNEITRRMPKISENISDQEFLDMYLNADGSLIKGRKESLAKALGEEVAFDMIKQDLQTDGPIFEALKNNQEALGTVLSDTVKEELSKQIERGNVKFSMNLESDVFEGLNILTANKADTSSLKYNEWYNSLPIESKEFWDKEVEPLFAKMDNAVRSHFIKNKPELIDKFKSLKEGIIEYTSAYLGSSVAESNPEVAAKQLSDFQEGLSNLIGNSLSNVKSLKIYGKSTRAGDLNEKTKNNLTKEPSTQSSVLQIARKAAVDASNKAIVYISGAKVNRINNFITNSIEGTPAEIAAKFEESLGKETREAKEANSLIFNYVNLAALEYILNSKNKNKAFASYLRWLETNNNNSAGLKSLAFVQGFEILPNQAVYLDAKGKKYYSKGMLKVVTEAVQKKTGKGLVINKNHTNWKEAKDFLNKTGKLKGLTPNEKDISIASALQIMGEHQQSMGETSIRLSEAMADMIEMAEQGLENNAIMDIFSTKVKEIYSNFGLVFNSSFIGDIQNKKFGKTSPLKKSRLIAVDKKLSNNFFNLQGERITEEGKKETAQVVKDLIKAKIIESKKDVKFSITKEAAKLSIDFNEMMSRKKGVDASVNYSKIVAKRLGAQKGKYKLYLPSSAEDFRLLTGYTFAGKGKQGTADMKWFEDNLIRPYTEAINAIDVAKQTTKNDFKALNKAMPKQAKTIGNLIPSKDYTNDQAVRVYLWNKAGYKVPGLNEKEINKLVSYVSGNPELAIYADALLAITKSQKWLKPGEHWDVQTILSDINNLTEKGGRKAYLAQWIENAEAIFSEENMNKIEALYGKRHREALEDSLYRMKNGTNRPSGSNAQVNRWNNWLNNSIGSIMFFNRRSAIMQLLSTVNFVNWSDNNPVNAAKAFANQKQYWSDFSYIFNSDKLKQRRGGLRSDVNEAEIASAAANSRNKAQAALSWLLKKGFTPTQIADSFAIASGGATFYRNRVNTYESQGLDIKEAESKAWLDFIEISDQAQQSGDPSLVSMEQASILGRLVLAFQNTTQQYSRLMKRKGLDIINRRQMPGTKSMLQSDIANFSGIMYYGAIQNIIFSALSASLFALIPGFDDNEEDESDAQKAKEKKIAYMFNGSVDSLLRGMGVRGAVVSTIKNVIMEYFKQKDKGYTADHTYTIIQAVNLSPPIGSKIKKVYSAIKGYEYDEDVIKERGFDVTANGRVNLSPSYRVFGTLAAGSVNLPIDRMYTEIQGMAEMLDERNTMYQRLALALGWRTWDVNAKNEEDDLIKAESGAIRIKQGREKAKAKRELKKQVLIEKRKKAFLSLSPLQQSILKNMSKNKKKKVLDKMIKDME